MIVTPRVSIKPGLENIQNVHNKTLNNQIDYALFFGINLSRAQ